METIEGVDHDNADGAVLMHYAASVRHSAASAHHAQTPVLQPYATRLSGALGREVVGQHVAHEQRHVAHVRRHLVHSHLHRLL